ncbi:VOC family protein [Oscillatoria sp. FACHB-1407]|uniref:VOC family protein n=1 Tax=Oscillatoria sp. FACHB-1407 TaxID=2692847 RepID=UPI00168A0469|nr:VOC family protein [Oscillatoria sp. FACHB-1407]MBD2463341.1 VOC family protein [Oscillatoria sp. FACHB-1407]
MNFKRFEHINLSCRNLDATQRFYQTLFPDWVVRAQGEWQGERWLHLGNNQFYLALNDATDDDRLQLPYEGVGINHVGFVIEDGEGILTLLNANGIEHYTMNSPETKFRIYINDPDGNEIELVEYQETYTFR